MEVERFADFGSDPVVIDASGKTSYRELAEMVRACGELLKANGVRSGDAVVARIRTGAQFLAAFLACQQSDIVFTPLTSASSDQRVRHVATLLGAEHFLSLRAEEIQLEKIVQCASGDNQSSFKQLFQLGGFVRFTSGTTAAPKGVFVSPPVAAQRVRSAYLGLNLSAGAKMLWPFEMALHFVTVLPVVLEVGGCFCVPRTESAASYNEILKLIEIEYIYAGPASYTQLINISAKRNGLKAAYSTTAPLAGFVRRAFEESWHTPLRQIYGIFEVGLVAIQQQDEMQSRAWAAPLPGVEIEVRDEAGQSLAASQLGTIHVRSDGILDAYLSPLRFKSEVAPDGWFNTGDIGALSATGELSVFGRAAAAIALDGGVVNPEGIEEVLCEYPDVIAARVSSRSNVELSAEVVLRAGAKINREELRSHCLERLEVSHVPQMIEQVEQLPFNESGKLVRQY